MINGDAQTLLIRTSSHMNGWRLCILAAKFALGCIMAAGPAFGLSLEEALQTTYERNPSILSQRRALMAVDEQLAQAISEWRPSLQADYNAGRQRFSYGSAGDTYADKETRQLTLTQPVFDGGGSMARYDAAEANIEAGRSELDATTQQVMLEAVTAYMHVLRDAEILRLSTENVQVLEKQKGATDERFTLGEVTKTDVAQSEARLARARSDKIQAEGSYASSIATFQRVVGASSQDIAKPGRIPELPATLDDALKQAEVMNPALKRALFTAEVRKEEVNVQEANLLPRVALQGQMRREEGIGGIYGNTDYNNDSILLNVNIPLYQSGAEYSRIRQARQNRASAGLDAMDARNTLQERVKQAWEEVNSNRATIQAYSIAVRAAEGALDGVRLEQLHGMRTVLDVLDAEQELFAARIGLIRAQNDEVVAAYGLLMQIGQLTPQRLGLQVPVYNPQDNLERVKFRPIGY